MRCHTDIFRVLEEVYNQSKSNCSMIFDEAFALVPESISPNGDRHSCVVIRQVKFLKKTKRNTSSLYLEVTGPLF